MSQFTTEGINFLKDQEALAAEIVNRFREWDSHRSTWKEEKKELRKYIVATDTTKTGNSDLPWKNKTTLPKLTQIRDNLHANYMAALFPNDNWLVWLGGDESGATEAKRRAIEAYSKQKLNNTEFKEAISSLVYDYIDYGNIFAYVVFENNVKVDPDTEEEIVGFVGPRLVRVSPFNIVFNPTAISFDKSPKILKYTKTIGELKADLVEHPDLGYDANVLDKILEERTNFISLAETGQEKSSGYVADGFTSFQNYFGSGYVEILEFWGDIYDMDTDTLYKDYVITVVDGKYILRKEANKSWLGQAPIKHLGWRKRPDNLWAMGPLDNLVGMQYRIDHLENLKADIFDLIAHPVRKVIGETVRYPEWGPNEVWQCGDEGDVQIVHPDTTALQADFQIQLLESKMEELAGAPREAMGMRTPGEKTKFEVQVLEQGAGRIFNAKTSHFEANFLEPLINVMFEMSRRNLKASDVIRVFEEETGVTEFLTITKEDITAKGKLIPQGARHFAEDAKRVQEMNTFLSTIGQDPGIRPHISGKEIARDFMLRFGMMGAFKENIHIEEQLETQKLMEQMRSQLEQEAATETAPQPEDFIDE